MGKFLLSCYRDGLFFNFRVNKKMKYWVYINEKVSGPYEEDSLAAVEGFTPDTLICAEDSGAGGSQDWVKASSLFEFDNAQPGFTSLTKQAAPVAAAAAVSTAAATSAMASAADKGLSQDNQVLLDKIEQLTLEIKGMKSKLEEAVAASNAAQKAAEERMEALARNLQQVPTTPETPENEDALVTNTESLLNHADQLIAEANTQENHPAMPEQAVSDNTKTEKTGEEEAVLRSALDSLYSAPLPVQTEEEKDSTFQDLLSPFKTAAVGAAVGAAAVVAANTLSGSKETPAEEQKAEPAAETAPAPQETPAEQKQEEPAPAEVTEEKREEIIDQITAPAQPQGEDFIAQALAEAQQEKEAAPATEEQPAEQKQEEPAPVEPSEAPSLDLEDHPQLAIDSANTAEDSTEQKQEEVPHIEVSSINPEEAKLTAMNPEEDVKPMASEDSQTIKELVPGKKVESETEDDGLISQSDLDEAFMERHTETDIPIPETSSPQTSQAFYQPHDMTEVQLNKGSTYLISDFIPPADMNGESADKKEEAKDGMETTPMEEIVPGGAPLENEQDDIMMSKISLENTIKAKRGATMDIKTVPMVQEPADSSRLDLTESGLDLNAQHDLQMADYSTGGSKLTKIIISALISIAFIGLIYIMLAYLELLPAKFNILKSGKPTAAQIQENKVNEMLPTPQAEQAPLTENELTPNMEEDANAALLNEVKQYALPNGQTLESLINARHPVQQPEMIEWSLTTAVEPDNYSVLVKIPPENPQSFKISYRFNYNAVTKELEPTTSDSKNLLDSMQPAPIPAAQ